MEELYIDLCNKIASPHRVINDVLDLFRAPYIMHDRATQQMLGVPEDILLLIGESIHYKKIGDIPSLVNGVLVQNRPRMMDVLLSKSNTRITLYKRGDRLLVGSVVRNLAEGVKNETHIHKKRDSDESYFVQFCYTPNMTFAALYVPNDADGDGKRASYVDYNFGHHTIKVPKCHASFHEDVGKMKYLYSLIATSTTANVEVDVIFTEFTNSFDVSIAVLNRRTAAFSIFLCSKTNKLIHQCSPDTPNIKKGLIDFFIEFATAINMQSM